MAEDILESFLRRVLEKAQQAGQGQGGQVPGGAPAGQAPPPPPAAAPPRRAVGAPPPRRQPPPDVEILEPEILDEGPRSREGVAEHVSRRLVDRVGEHASHLGEEVGQADERLEARLQKKFERPAEKRGKKKAKAQPSAPQRPAATPLSEPPEAAQAPEAKLRAHATSLSPLFELLRTPDRLRTAILLNEIFKRPEERW